MLTQPYGFALLALDWANLFRACGAGLSRAPLCCARAFGREERKFFCCLPGTCLRLACLPQHAKSARIGGAGALALGSCRAIIGRPARAGLECCWDRDSLWWTVLENGFSYLSAPSALALGASFLFFAQGRRDTKARRAFARWACADKGGGANILCRPSGAHVLFSAYPPLRLRVARLGGGLGSFAPTALGSRGFQGVAF